MTKICFALSCLLASLTIISCQKTNSSSTLVTTSITNVTGSSAVSGGTLISDGALTINALGIQWDTSARFTHPQLSLNESGASAFTGRMIGLLSNTTYYVRAYASTSVHTYYGNVLQFTTGANEKY